MSACAASREVSSCGAAGVPARPRERVGGARSGWPATPSLERVHVLYSGHVQGVGFRWRTTRCAAAFDANASAVNAPAVNGWVRNLSDGRVELVAEGDRATLEAFLASVRGEMGALIRDERATWGPARGDLAPFTIVR